MDRDALKDVAIDLRSRDGDHWTLEKVGETLGVPRSTIFDWVPESAFRFRKADEPVRMVGKDGCRTMAQVEHMFHLATPSG